jgi:hypothetical protein
MHLIAEFFQQQTQSVRPVAVIIHNQNPKYFILGRHNLISTHRVAGELARR